jgi:hypothetical protein
MIILLTAVHSIIGLYDTRHRVLLSYQHVLLYPLIGVCAEKCYQAVKMPLIQILDYSTTLLLNDSMISDIAADGVRGKLLSCLITH